MKVKQCQCCEYKATTNGNLKIHIQSKHEGKTYQCQCCEYKASRNDYLKTHNQSINEGKTFNIVITNAQ